MVRANFLLLNLLVIFVLMGCSQNEEIIKSDKSIDSPAGNVKYTSQKPPQLKIGIKEEVFPTALGGYIWSYFGSRRKFNG